MTRAALSLAAFFLVFHLDQVFGHFFGACRDGSGLHFAEHISYCEKDEEACAAKNILSENICKNSMKRSNEAYRSSFEPWNIVSTKLSVGDRKVFISDHLGSGNVTISKCLTSSTSGAQGNVFNTHEHGSSVKPISDGWRIAKILHLNGEERSNVKSIKFAIYPLHSHFGIDETDVSSNFSLPNARSIRSNLVHFNYSLTQSPSLHPENRGLYRADSHQGRSQIYDPPIGRRLITSLALVPLGFLLALSGGKNLDDKRITLGALKTSFGFLMVFAGFGLLLILNWPDSNYWLF